MNSEYKFVAVKVLSEVVAMGFRERRVLKLAEM